MVLLDLNMPRMGGLEFMEEMRGDPDLRRILVFVMTTSSAPEDRMRAYDLNAAGYLPKHRPGQSFLKMIGMLQQFLRMIEFPD
jgi:CheY-like chemotaxis protein